MSTNERNKYLKSISIQNYKSISYHEIEFNPSVNVFIGGNNTGKSNILKCIDEFMSYNKDSYTEISRFNNPTQNKPKINILTSSETTYKFNIDYKTRAHVHNYKNNLNAINDAAEKYINEAFKFAAIFNETNNIELIEEMKNFIIQLKNEKNSLKGFISNVNRDLAILSREHYSMSIIDEEIYICDSYGDTSTICEKSNGIQKMLIFSYIINKATLNRNDMPHFLLIDEPELHLHVDAQRHLFTRLKEKFSNSQIFITTHSPVFINNVDVDSLFFVERDIEYGTITTVQTESKSDYKKINAILGLNLMDSMSIDTKNSIILVEGHSDKILHHYLYHRLFPKKKKNFISIEGVDNLYNYLKIYEEILVNPPLAILDYDNQALKSVKKVSTKSYEKYNFRFYFNNGISLSELVKEEKEKINEADTVVLEDLFGSEFLKKNIKSYMDSEEKKLTVINNEANNFCTLINSNINDFNKIDYAIHTINELENLNEEKFKDLTKIIMNTYININKYSL